jgi:hypothetical protein
MKLLLLLLTFTSSVFASEFDLKTYSTSLDFAQVNHVTASQKVDGSWCFYTEVRHDDQGWDHYADGWEVLDLAGKQIDYRLLAHPHVNEQPFTRSKCDIQIPKDISKVIVRAKCKTHGFGGKPVLVDLNMNKGEGFSIRKSN